MGKFCFHPACCAIHGENKMCLSWFMGKFIFPLSWLRHSRGKIPSLFLHTKGLANWLTFVEHQYFPSKSRTFVQLSKVSLMPSKIKEKGKMQDLKSFEDSCSITLQTSLCFGLVRKLVDSSEHGSFKTTCPFLHVLAHPCVKSTWSSGHEHSPFLRQVPRFVMLQTESSPKWQDIP